MEFNRIEIVTDLPDMVDSISNSQTILLIDPLVTMETPAITSFKVRDIIRITGMVIVATVLLIEIIPLGAMAVQNPCSRFLGIRMELST